MLFLVLLLVSEQTLEWTKVRTGENPHCSTDFNKIKINVSILFSVLNNKMFHAVHRPKPIDF